jgi:peptide/nickel transport system ATP-binding protein
MSTKPLLRVNKLSVTIDVARADSITHIRPLEQMSFELHAGETLVLLGESGCGKSMTALSLMRLLPEGGRITGGGIQLHGKELCELSEAEMRAVRGGEMAMIFQEPGTSLNPVLSVGTQINEVLAAHRNLHGAAARDEAERLLQIVGIPDAARRLNEYPMQLSGGMKQRVMIAMALAGEPEVLIADEPTTALDVTIQAQVLALLADLQRQRGMGMLLITHDLGVVAQVADRVGVMYAGELIEVATREQFFAAPAHPYSRKLFEALPEGRRDGGPLATIPGSVPPLDRAFAGCRFVERCPNRLVRCETVIPQWQNTSSGQQVRCHLYDPGEPTTIPDVARNEDNAQNPGMPSPSSEDNLPLLEVRDLHVYFPVKRGLLQRTVGYVKAVDGVSFTLRAGKTLALVGESGCGKTSAGKALLNLIAASEGEILFHGNRLDPARPRDWRAARRELQMVFQDPFGSLNPRMRVVEIVEEGLVALDLERDALKRRQRVEQIVSQVGLRADMLDRYPHEFSGGQRQRIAIARALAVNPQLIVCDEPTSALDVSVQAQVLNLMRELQTRLGLSYLFITHNIGVVEYLADEIAVMYLGRIVEYGSAEVVLHHPQHPYTQALLAAAPRIAAGREPKAGAAATVGGDLPSSANQPVGCHFHTRCPRADARCRLEAPALERSAQGQWVSCHFVPHARD